MRVLPIPKRAASGPESAVATANVPEKPKTTHPTSAGPASKACAMAGCDTAAAVVLATVRKTAAIAIARMAAGDSRPLGACMHRTGEMFSEQKR